MNAFAHKHLLGIEGLSQADMLQVLDTAKAFFEVSRRPVRKVPTLRGKTIINVFYEASTRTRTSFEIAGKRLSADVINISIATSSVSKGETLKDTCMTLQAMNPDVIVIRHSASGAADYVTAQIDASVVNAGDGMHEHPTQALLDAFTVREAKGTLSGLTIAICGDIAHSRVARSNIQLWRAFGSNVRIAAPQTLLPSHVDSLGAKVCATADEAIEGADVVMALRIQKERLAGALLPSMREYSRMFGINTRRMRLAKPDALLMHPGPMNRGVEVEPDVADGAQSRILDQVEAGVAVRMAVLYLLASESSEAAAVDA